MAKAAVLAQMSAVRMTDPTPLVRDGEDDPEDDGSTTERIPDMEEHR